MVKPDLPGAFEQMVLLAVLRLGDEAYGRAVRRELESRTGMRGQAPRSAPPLVLTLFTRDG